MDEQRRRFYRDLARLALQSADGHAAGWVAVNVRAIDLLYLLNAEARPEPPPYPEETR